jgi:hypothetical protein
MWLGKSPDDGILPAALQFCKNFVGPIKNGMSYARAGSTPQKTLRHEFRGFHEKPSSNQNEFNDFVRFVQTVAMVF